MDALRCAAPQVEGVRFIRDTIASRRVAVVLDLDSTLLESEFLPSGQPADWCVRACVGWSEGGDKGKAGAAGCGCVPPKPSETSAVPLPHPPPPAPAALHESRSRLDWRSAPLTQQPSGVAAMGRYARLPDEPHHAEAVHAACWVWKGASHAYRVRQRLGWSSLRDLLIRVGGWVGGGGGRGQMGGRQEAWVSSAVPFPALGPPAQLPPSAAASLHTQCLPPIRLPPPPSLPPPPPTTTHTRTHPP